MCCWYHSSIIKKIIPTLNLWQPKICKSVKTPQSCSSFNSNTFLISSFFFLSFWSSSTSLLSLQQFITGFRVLHSHLNSYRLCQETHPTQTHQAQTQRGESFWPHISPESFFSIFLGNTWRSDWTQRPIDSECENSRWVGLVETRVSLLMVVRYTQWREEFWF